ncbi:DUF7827 domain-containing protein, partial [Natrialba asiatica]|uniref:DUF7827 domain-containing protein n=1 Tax=Natrialba asiatica TaxID=64602 RepID=UPI0012694297
MTAESDEFSVEETPEGDITFPDTFDENLGNTGEIVVNINNYDGAVYVQFGDEDSSNYQTLLEVEDTSDSGNVTIEYDTTEVGTSAFSLADSDDSLEHLYSTDGIDAPLEPGHSYSLTAGIVANATEGNVTDKTDGSSFYLNEREGMNGLESATAPAADDLDDAVVTETDEIANGDQLLGVIEANDVFALLSEDDDADSLASNDVNISVTEVNPGANAEPETWSNIDGVGTEAADGPELTGDDIEIVETDEENGTVLFALNSYDFLENNEAYELNVSLEEGNVLLSGDEDESVSTEFSLAQPELELDDSN